MTNKIINIYSEISVVFDYMCLITQETIEYLYVKIISIS